jgi:hypothetical protein
MGPLGLHSLVRKSQSCGQVVQEQIVAGTLFFFFFFLTAIVLHSGNSHGFSMLL